jgi:predicted nucleic acid-binding protein
MSGLFMTDFSLHSIGVLLFRRRNFDAHAEFVGDLETVGIRVLSLHPREVSALAEPAIRHNVDFDDAYQYAVAKHFDLTLVNFDSDFDRTDLKRNTPQEILERLG